MNAWIKHPRSKKPDAMLSIAVYSTVLILIKFFFSGMTIGVVHIDPLDAGVVAALLTPTLGAYAMRKYSDSPDKQKESQEDDQKD